MSRKKIKMWVFTVLLLIFVITITVVPGFAANAGKVATNELVSVKITKGIDKIEIKASLTEDYVKDKRGSNIFLFELLPYQSVSQINTMEYIATEKVASSVIFRIDFNKNDKAQLFSKFIAAEKLADGSYSIITGARYIENPDIVAERNYAYPEYESKKGLQIQLLTDAQELGISHTVINIPINEYILTYGGSNSYSYIYNNRTYYIDKAKLDLLDHRIKILTEAGVNIYLNIMISAPENSSSEDMSVLYAAEKSGEAALYALNTKNRDGVYYYESVLSFLAERYTMENREYGFAGSFIVGYEINSNRNWNYMGQKTLAEYLNSYAVCLRIADTAMRSVYSNGRVYLSVANNFNVAANDTGTAVDVTLDYPAKDVIEQISTIIKYSGDIPWNLAINPYSSDTSNAAFWNDDKAYDDYDTPYITMKNIDTFTSYMSQSEFLYNLGKRRILISELGFNTETSENGEQLQAAAYAYAYYKAVSNTDIEALIYHRHVDHSGENEMRFGLWYNVEGTLIDPLSKKYIYNVFKNIDTASNVETTEFAPEIIGAKDWKELLPDLSLSDAAVRTVIDAIPVLPDSIPKKYTKRTWFDFSEGSLFGFYPTDNAEYIELNTGDPVQLETEGETSPEDSSTEVSDSTAESITETHTPKLHAKLYNIEKYGYMGIGRSFSEPYNIDNLGYISLDISVSAPEKVSSATVMVRLYSSGKDGKKSAVYDGVIQIKPNTWQTLTFQISSLAEVTDTIDGIKIWVKPYDDNTYGGEMWLWLKSITAYESGSVDVFTVILKVLLAVVILMALAAAFIIIRYVLYMRKKKIMAQRRAQARAARMAQSQTEFYNTGEISVQHKMRPMRNPSDSLRNDDKRHD